MDTQSKPKHLGRNISRLRELRGMKQLALAEAMGVSQQTISNMESSETIEDDKLEQVAKALEVSVEAIRNFSEEAVINIINNTFSDFKDNSSAINYNCVLNFNPLDKLIESYEENKKLYERLLEAEKKR
jgi:transcriptional regulator with XRE-family HTH domain